MEIKSKQLWSLVQPRLREYLSQTWDFNLVASMTGSTKLTVTGWLADQIPPGERLIRLWYLLEASGLKSPELNKLPSFNRYCGELLTFSILDMKDLQSICNLASSQGVLSMLRGTPPLRPQYTLDELGELYGEMLQPLKQGLTQLDTPGPERLSLGGSVQATAPVSVDDGSFAETASVNMLFEASRLCSVLPLVRYFDSDDCSAEQRSRLRRLVGNEEMFDLSNHFNNLCSERARELGRSGKQR
jgi:hypothetical protein